MTRAHLDVEGKILDDGCVHPIGVVSELMMRLVLNYRARPCRSSARQQKEGCENPFDELHVRAVSKSGATRKRLDDDTRGSNTSRVESRE